MTGELMGLPSACLALLLALAVPACGATPRSRWGHSRQLPLNLEPLFNNDALAGPARRADGNFDCPDHPANVPGSTFPAEYLPASGTKFMLDGVWYLFPSKEPGDENNVACNGQRLRVPAGRYRALHLLGAAENGSYRAPLTLAYQEGPAEVELALTDWCQRPKFGEDVAFEAPFRTTWSSLWNRVVREEAVRPRLFIQTIRLDPEKTLESLALPYQRRIHLFAATLEAVTWEQAQVDYANEAAELYESLPRRKPEAVAVVRRKLDSLAEELDALAAAGGPFARQLGWLRVQADHVRHRLGQSVVGRAHIAPGRLRSLSRSVRRIGADLQALQGGHDPFPAKRGNFLRAHRSPVDGSLQPYSLSVPADYTGEEPFPLMVSLHGHGWYRPFQGHPQPVVEGVLMVAPHGRGSQDYMLVAERDVLAVVDDVCRDYRVDPRRIILEGHSMGGTGSWQLGVHYPHRFACVAPVCGNADRRAWDAWKPKLHRTRQPHPIPPRFAALRTHLLDRLDPVTYAGNLLHVPALCAHGAEDDVVPVGHSRHMAERLRARGCQVQYFEFPLLRHWGFPQSFYETRWAWMLAQRRPERPPRVRYKTACLRHHQAYWVRLERLAEPLAFATVDARRQEDGRIEVTSENVAAFTLLPSAEGRGGPVRVRINGQEVVAGDGAATFVRGGEGRWAVGELPPGPAKKPGLEGPVGDVFLDPFLLVRGTTSEDPWHREVIRRQVEAFARDWERMYNCRPRVKDDAEVTDADIRRFHLVCTGGPAANALTARVAAKLPIRIRADAVRVGERVFRGADVGVKLCYPNPLNSERLVAVFAGLGPAALDQINNRFGNWFGWGPYDNYDWFDYAVFDARTYDPESFLLVGFFDQRWRLDERWQFPGDEAVREAMLPRRVPRHPRLPDPPPATLALSDLAPAVIDQHKGCVGFDRSYEGGPLELGRRTFQRGLGVKPPSALEYELGGHYRVFRATVGIDLEGALEVSEARARSEWVQFLVFGDGRRLYSSEWLQWDSAPVDVEVEIDGVETLRLEVECSSARWLVGSADWAEARVSRR